MTGSLTVAYSELTRVLPWSLRALGYPFGTADRGAHVVAAAAAMEPDVLGHIACARPRPSRSFQHTVDGGKLTIDAQGVSMLEVGPVAMDWLAAHSEEDGIGTCRIVEATEQSLLPAVLLTGADYGMSSVAMTMVGNTFRWSVVQNKDEEISFFSGSSMDDLRRASEDDDVLFAEISGWNPVPGQSLIIAKRQPLSFSAAVEGQSPKRKLLEAFSKGIPIAEETLRQLYKLEMITWAPTSERSRTQAGFKQHTDSTP